MKLHVDVYILAGYILCFKNRRYAKIIFGVHVHVTAFLSPHSRVLQHPGRLDEKKAYQGKKNSSQKLYKLVSKVTFFSFPFSATGRILKEATKLDKFSHYLPVT